MFIAADTTATTVLVAPINKEDRVLELERQLAEQAKRIGRLEFMLLQTTMTAVTLNEPAPKATSSSAMPSAKNMVSTLAESKPRFVEGLTAGGDIRLRQEFNFSDTDAVDRSRNALRARLRATYSPIPSLTIGAQLSTGDPGDPNSTDVTLGNFVDDFNVSLDQVWLRYQMGGLTLHGGKFALIFQRTDMVWDGDFVPQGVGVTYTSKFIGGTSVEARAAYVIIEESLGGRGSAMLGGQLSASVPLAAAWRFGLSGGYYDYSLNGIATADSGDFRSNLLSSGSYLSDFRLVDGIATLAYTGLGDRWPIILSGEYVRNLGAAVSADSGVYVELAAGRATRPGDWRVSYAYSEVGVDAVFAAFSHDNLAISTNYQLHSLGVTFALAKYLMLDTTFVHYRPLDADYAGTNAATDWLDRIRLNLTVNF